ncbi:MAG: daunorubicin/doxorubicin resistance ABC transporter ATP-binding protein DrrA, partial [Chloroflexota bacterium]
PVLFLDEPTTGLDLRSRLVVWQMVRALVTAGTTVLLTTQYLEEADQLADRIAVIDGGCVIASGTPDDLKARVGGARLEVTVANETDLESTARLLRPYGDGGAHVDRERRRVVVPVADGAGVLVAVVRELDAAGIRVDDLGLHRPTLDDVFLALTGHVAQSAETEDAATPAATRHHGRREKI